MTTNWDNIWRGVYAKGDRKRVTNGEIVIVKGRKLYKTKLLSTMSEFDLIHIAWTLGIVNPVGFSNEVDGMIFPMDETKHSFSVYYTGWRGISKEKIIAGIWNYLVDHDLMIKRNESDLRV